MTPTESRTGLTSNQLRSAFKQHPKRNNQEWANLWGISKEAVRKLRKTRGLAPTSQILRQIRAEEHAKKNAAKAVEAALLSDRMCPVDGALVPVRRKLTCSSKCAQVYRSTFVHRVTR